jgi:uncharacterized protein YndB with AHSA1/START domain
MDTLTHRIHIKASPEAIWAALTDGDQAERYGYRSRVEYDLRPGGAYRGYANEAMLAYGSPDVIIEGEVIEVDAPRRLVQTWHALFDQQTADEATTTLTFELEPEQDGVTKVTVTQDLAGAPTTAALVSGSMPNAGGGWPFVLSDLKTLLETGAPLAGRPEGEAIKEATITRVFDAPRDVVWLYFTEPEYFAEWFGHEPFTTPVSRITMDVRPGGEFRAAMVNESDGAELPFVGCYREVDAHEEVPYHQTGHAGTSSTR